jgi:predicted O-methyltransferase YrrM
MKLMIFNKIKIILNNPEFLLQYYNRNSRLAKILDIDKKTLESFFEESNECFSYIEEKMKNYPDNVRMGIERIQVLYSCIRAFKPNIMIETGVAGGSSSYIILKAMEKNNFGKLYSIDIDNPLYDERVSEYHIGWMVPKELKNIWTLILGDSMEELPKLLNSLDSIDIFFHDSDHSYEHMMFEFNSAIPYFKEEIKILSDDIEKNSSFDKISNTHNLFTEKFYGFGIGRSTK